VGGALCCFGVFCVGEGLGVLCVWLGWVFVGFCCLGWSGCGGCCVWFGAFVGCGFCCEVCLFVGVVSVVVWDFGGLWLVLGWCMGVG